MKERGREEDRIGRSKGKRKTRKIDEREGSEGMIMKSEESKEAGKGRLTLEVRGGNRRE